MVNVFANSANPADWNILRGELFFARFTFGLFKPKDKVIRADFAGMVAGTGKNANQFNAGERVFGELLKGGAFAEYSVGAEISCAHISEEVGLPEIVGVKVAGLTALQALIIHGMLKEGQTVLINGEPGGVGYFVVQITKAYEAIVTTVCSFKNKNCVKTFGADSNISFNKVNLHQHNGSYDLIVYTYGNLSFSEYKRMGN